MQQNRKYQFSILRLLLLMTAIAAVLGLAKSFSVSPRSQFLLGLYLSLYAAWLIMRWPVVYVGLMEVRRRRRSVLKRRRALEIEIAQKQRQLGRQANRAGWNGG
jgi:hypothetical protein